MSLRTQNTGNKVPFLGTALGNKFLYTKRSRVTCICEEEGDDDDNNEDVSSKLT